MVDARVMVDDRYSGIYAVVMGNSGGPSEMKYSPTGKPVATVSVAVGSIKKDMPPQWVTLTFWEEMAETVNKVVIEKGLRVKAEGRITQELFEAMDKTIKSKLKMTDVKVLWIGNRQNVFVEVVAGDTLADIKSRAKASGLGDDKK